MVSLPYSITDIFIDTNYEGAHCPRASCCRLGFALMTVKRRWIRAHITYKLLDQTGQPGGALGQLQPRASGTVLGLGMG